MHIIREIAATNNELIFSSELLPLLSKYYHGDDKCNLWRGFWESEEIYDHESELSVQNYAEFIFLNFLILRFPIIAIISSGVICMYSCNNITSSKKWCLPELTLIYDYFYTAGQLVPNSNIFDTAQTQVYVWCINISVCPIKPL